MSPLKQLLHHFDTGASWLKQNARIVLDEAYGVLHAAGVFARSVPASFWGCDQCGAPHEAELYASDDWAMLLYMCQDIGEVEIPAVWVEQCVVSPEGFARHCARLLLGDDADVTRREGDRLWEAVVDGDVLPQPVYFVRELGSAQRSAALIARLGRTGNPSKGVVFSAAELGDWMKLPGQFELRWLGDLLCSDESGLALRPGAWRTESRAKRKKGHPPNAPGLVEKFLDDFLANATSKPRIADAGRFIAARVAEAARNGVSKPLSAGRIETKIRPEFNRRVAEIWGTEKAA